MKDNLEKALERMQSENTVKIANIFYDFRDTGITAREIADFTGLSVSQISSRRANLEKVYGFKFSKVGRTYYLTDITLEYDPEYIARQRRLHEKRKKWRKEKASLRSRITPPESSFSRAFALMGV